MLAKIGRATPLLLAALIIECQAVSWANSVSTSSSIQIAQSNSQARQHLQQGRKHYEAGEFEKAIASWQQALKLYQQQQDTEGEARAYGDLGAAYQAIGNYPEAISAYEQSLQRWRQLNKISGEAQALRGLGNTHYILGNYRQATQLHEESLAIANQLDDTRGASYSYNTLGAIYAHQNEHQQAIIYYQQSLAAAKASNNPTLAGKVLNNLGAIAHTQNQYDSAEDYYQQAAEIGESTGDLRLQATARSGMGLALANQGEYQQALEFQQQSIQIAEKIGDRSVEATARSNLAYTLWLTGQYAEAQKELETTVNLLESLRLGLDDLDRVSLFDTQFRAYDLLLQVLVAQHEYSQALEVAERGRARAFVELLTRRQDSLYSPTISQTNIKHTGKTEKSQQLAGSWGSSSSQTQSQPVEQVTSPTMAQIAQIAEAHDATIVEYALISDINQVGQGKIAGSYSHLYIWVVQPTGELAFRSIDLNDINLSAESPSAFFSRGSSEEFIGQDTVLQELHQVLIAPIADILPTNPEDAVIFIPHRELFLIAFPALQNQQGKYLIEQHTILTAPAIQVLDLTYQKRNSIPDQSNALVVGNPTISKQNALARQTPEIAILEALPGAEQEARIVANFLNTQPLIGNEATETIVKQKMPSANIIHLATHGLLSDISGTGVPGVIILAADGVNDGGLSSDEILELELNADLVIVSACNTGRGLLSGDGVIGLSRSLLASGTSSLIVSLWAIPDQPTAELMEAFYLHRQQGLNKAQALRQAMLTTIQNHPDPINWAAFTLIGEAE